MKNKKQFGEQETSGGESAPQGTKWESGAQRGKANPIGNTTWESGAQRGKANPIGNTKWESGAQRGKANPL
jgi:hypothetical protein